MKNKKLNLRELNFWFYLLSTGGSGTNDIGTNYNVTGIGVDKAAAIAFRLNTVYLTSNDQYLDARIWGIQAAQDLYGAGSAEVISTANAWCAVGVCVNTCSSDATITGTTYSQPLSESSTWIKSSGQTTILNTTDVRLDADPGIGYVELNAANTNDFFLSSPFGNGVFIAQALDGCSAGSPARFDSQSSEAEPLVKMENIIEEHDFLLYPNPTKGYFTIEIPEIYNVSLSIYNMQGREVYVNREVKSNRIEIDLSDQHAGIYFVRVASDNPVWVEKIIKDQRVSHN